MEAPDRPGVWLRTWTTRSGVRKRRVMIVRDGRALDLVRQEWGPLRTGLDGDWEWLREDGHGTATAEDGGL